MLKIAIIGCGTIGKRHAGQASCFGELIAVCDIVKEKAHTLAEEYSARAYRSVEDMLAGEKELDLLAICTPNGLHAAHSIMGSRAGLHVICEKPMALSSIDCRSMIQEAEKAEKYLFVVKQNRFNPAVITVKDLMDKGVLGRIYSVNVNGCWHRGDSYYRNSWRGTKEMDGGILYTQFSHFIDLLYWLIGDIEEVSAYRNNFAHKDLRDFEDAVVAAFKFDNGAIGSAHFTTNSYLKNMEGSLMIVAENGTVKIGGQYLNLLEYERIKGEKAISLLAGNPPNDYGEYQGSMSNHDKIYAYICDAILEQSPNLFNGYQGLKTVEIIEKIYQATS